MFSLSKETKPVLWFSLLYLAVFTPLAFARGNAEFVIYLGVVVFFLLLILAKHQKLGLSLGVLWGLSIWGLLHMAGGNVPVNGSVLYNLQLVPVFLKYDQLVHAFGFGVTTVVGWQLLRPYLKEQFNWTTIGILLVMIGIGAGALNEIIEFLATVLVPETNVGGYVNTALDLVFNLLGATIAAIYIYRSNR